METVADLVAQETDNDSRLKKCIHPPGRPPPFGTVASVSPRRNRHLTPPRGALYFGLRFKKGLLQVRRAGECNQWGWGQTVL